MKYILYMVAIFLSACASSAQPPLYMPPPMTPIQQYPASENTVEKTGSLYDPGTGMDLYTNSRASRVGDIVMVQIVDNSKAEHKADTTLERTSDLSFGINAFGGQTDALGAPVGKPLFGVGSKNKTTGKAETSRENTLTATIATRVVQVLPGGLLQIEGVRATQVNNEVQYLVVKGLVRKRDVDADNNVLSTKLAESTIGYYGKGDLSDQQKQGWGNRLVNAIWPF